MKRLHTYLIFVLTASLLMLGLSQVAVAKGPRNKVNVELATPSEATQGVEETVLITGSGFDEGSQVNYLVTGTSDAS